MLAAVAARGRVELREVARPRLLQAEDALLRVHASAVTGADLVRPGVGLALGRSLVGVVESTGEAVTRFGPGDRVVAAGQVADGSCPACRAGRFHLCSGLRVLGEGALGGAHAELVRVPHADVNLLAVPVEVGDLVAVWLGDVVPTAWAAVADAEAAPGRVLLVLGAGPVGLAAALSARHAGARVHVVDPVPARLEQARRLGLDAVDPGATLPLPESVVECAGTTSALLDALARVAPGGTVSVVGRHAPTPVALPVAELSGRAVRVHFGGLANIQAVWEDSLNAVRRSGVLTEEFTTLVLPLSQAPRAFELVGAQQAATVVLSRAAR